MLLSLTPRLLSEAIISALLICAGLVFFLLRFARGRLWVGVALGVALADQASKFVVIHFLRGGKSVALPGSAALVYHENPLLGFEMADPGLVTATLAALAALLLLSLRLRRYNYRMGFVAELGGALILGGCVGILIDRVRLGFVIDFLDFGPRSEFIYNLADLAVLGAFVLLVARGGQWLAIHRPKPSVRPNNEPVLADDADAGRLAAKAMLARFGKISPRAMAEALGLHIERRPRPMPDLASLRVRSEYLTHSAAIVLYEEPLQELAQLLRAKRPRLAGLNLEELHIAHELFHHLESGRPAASEKAAHSFVRHLLGLDFFPAELDSLYGADCKSQTRAS